MSWSYQTLILLFFVKYLASAQEEYTVERANEYIEKNKDSVNQTYRLKYHFAAPIGWINDPNGLIYFKGEYHLFYQVNPYNSFHNKISWGHAKSKDLIKWEHLPVALVPDKDYDRDGVFSGSAIEKDGKLYLMYSGNRQGQTQCIAVSEDGIHFTKVPENPVIDARHLPENANPFDFRDPKVFKRGHLYYVIVGSKTKDDLGQALLFQSDDLIKWTFKSVVLQAMRGQGVMWECPDLFELNGKDVLVLSAVAMPSVGNDYRNQQSVIEFVGKMDWEKGTLAVETMKEVDHGFDYYATQSLLDDKGRRIAIAWMNVPGRSLPTHDLGHKWQNALTLPRELRLVNNRVRQIPVPEIWKYCGPFTRVFDLTLDNEIKEFAGVSGDVAVLDLKIDLSEAKRFEIQVRANEEEKTVVSYDTKTSEVALDRSKSGIIITGAGDLLPRKVKVPLNGGKLNLEIFLDKSSVEVFVNDGLETLTAVIFPIRANSRVIRFKANGKVVIKHLKFALIEV